MTFDSITHADLDYIQTQVECYAVPVVCEDEILKALEELRELRNARAGLSTTSATAWECVGCVAAGIATCDHAPDDVRPSEAPSLPTTARERQYYEAGVREGERVAHARTAEAIPELKSRWPSTRKQVTRSAYEALVSEDLAWLDQQPRTLEATHIRAIVAMSVEGFYGERSPDYPIPGACGDDCTDRDDGHVQCVCWLVKGHPGDHYDPETLSTWTRGAK